MNRACLIVLGLACLCWSGQASASSFNPAVEYSTTGTLNDSRPFTLGYEFTTSVTLDINALGYWVDGLGHNHQVGIWDSTGNLLASTTVLSTDPIQGHFQYDAISELVLAPGTYTIGGEFLGNSDPFPANAQGVVTIPGFTWVQDEQIVGSGLNFPTDTVGIYGQNGILLANFSVGSALAVPEPASLSLLGTATVAGAVFAGLRRRKKAMSA
jgi:hypothetical protein